MILELSTEQAPPSPALQTPPWRAEMISSWIWEGFPLIFHSKAWSVNIPNATGGKGGSIRDLQSSTELKMSRMNQPWLIVFPFPILLGLLRSGQNFPLSTCRDFPFKHLLKSKQIENTFSAASTVF